MSSNTKPVLRSSSEKTAGQAALSPAVEPDDRYPGTFFRIPGPPRPGKTTWSVAK